MPSAHTKKTELAPSSVVVSSGPLPGTEPGAGAIKVRINRRVFWRIASVLLVALSVFGVFNLIVADPTVRLGNATFNVRVADEPYEHVIGLSDTPSLAPNEGMLFVLQEPQYLPIWMKDMDFALDIIWLNEDKRVINIHRNVSPDTYPQAFLPNEPAMYVLEVPAGSAEAGDIQDGQQAKLNLGLLQYINGN